MYPLIIYFWQWRVMESPKIRQNPSWFPRPPRSTFLVHFSGGGVAEIRAMRGGTGIIWQFQHSKFGLLLPKPFNRIRQRLPKKTGVHSMVYLMNREIWIEFVTQYVSVIRQLCFCSSFSRSALFAPHLPPTCPRWWPARWAKISYISYYPHESCLFFGVDPVQ